MTVLELKDKRNKLMNDAAKLIQQKDVTTEHRSQFDAMMADVDVLEDDISRHERTAKFETEQRSAARPPRPKPGADVQGDSELATLEKRAFSEYIRYGQVSPENRSYLHAAETRDLGTVTGGSITGGGQLVPQAFNTQLFDAQKIWGALTTIVNTKKTDSGAPMKIAFVNDTGNQLTVLGEATQVTEADPSFSGVLSSTDQCTTGVVKVSLAELEDSAFDIDSWIRNAFGKRYWRGVTQMLTQGSSSGNVQAITSGVPVVVGIAGSTITMPYENLITLYSALEPAYEQTASWLMNSSTRATMMGVLDGFGRPLYIPSPNTGAFDRLLGRPVVLNQYLPNIAASSKPLMLGDFKEGYTFRTVGDLNVIRLNERYIEFGEIGFIGFARIGGFQTDAGTHPLITLQMAAS